MQTQRRHNLGAFALLAAVLLLLAPLPAEALQVTDVAVTSKPANGDNYLTGEIIEVTVTFDKRARGGPYFFFTSTRLNVVIGTNTRRFEYASGDGTTQLVYSYTVLASDSDTDGISVTGIFSSGSSLISTANDVRPTERLPNSEYALPRNQIANAALHKVNRSITTTGIFYHAQTGNTEAFHSGVDYRPATALAFDGRNRPYLLSYARYGTEPADNRFSITTLRNGEWTSFSFKDELEEVLGPLSPTLPIEDKQSQMIIDNHDDLYAVMRWVAFRPAGSSTDERKHILIYAQNVASSSFNGDFEILEFPGKLPLLESRMSANDFANYPPLVGYIEGQANPPNPYTAKHSWSQVYWYNFYVLPLRRDASGALVGRTLNEAIYVDNKLGYVTNHSGGQSFAVTRGDTSFMVYMKHEGALPYANNTVYVKAFHRKNHASGVGDTLSARQQLFISHPDFGDGHSTPVIAIDNDGYIHVQGGAHGGPFAYRKSSHPMDITSWGSTANIGSGRTYSSLVIDNLNNMFSALRASSSSQYQLFFQAGSTTTGFANNNGTLFADQNCGNFYRVYYHSQHKDRPEPGTNERVYVNWSANCRAAGGNWDKYRVLAHSDDQGRTFHITTKADFVSRIESLDTTPDAFTFTAKTGVSPGTAVTSNAITVSGINALASISVSGGTLMVNGSDFTGTTVANGQTVAVKVTASSGSNRTTTARVTIGGVHADFSVSLPNDAPTAEAGNNQTVNEGDTVTLSGSGTDPENDTLTYSWRQTSGTTVTLSSTGVAAPTFTAPNLGANEDLVFELTVSDGRLSGTDTVTITIRADNDAPTAEAGDNKTVAGEAAVALSGSGTDPEGKPVTYSWSQTGGSPSVSLTGSTTKTPSFIAPKVNTALTFTLTVSDGDLSGTDTVTITVQGDNTAPTAAAGTNQTVDEGDLVTLSGSGTHPQRKPLTYSWRQTSGATVTLSSTGVAAPTFTAPNLGANEDLVFELTVSDGSVSGTATVTITIEADNDAPTAEAGNNQTVDEGDTVTLSGSGTDPENDTLTYSWRQTSGKTVTLSSTGVAAPTFTAPNLGANEDLVFELTVSDGDLSGTDTVTITIEADNDAPTAEAGDNKTVAGEAAVALSGSGTDPENDTLSYSWRQTGGSPSVSLTGSTTQTPSFIAPKVNTALTFTLMVSDGDLSGSDTVTITVQGDNTAPTAEAGPKQTVDEGTLVVLSGSGTHPQRKRLTYAWRQLSGTDVTLSSTGVVAPTFTAPNLGANEDLVFELTVSDGDLSGTDTVTITIEADNDAPTAEAGDNQTVDEGDAVTLSGSGTDPEGESVTYAWRQTAGSPSVSLTGSTTKTPSFTAPDVAANTALTFTLTVSDGDLSGTDTVTITIEAADTTPDAFTFTAKTGVSPGTAVTSDAITVSGLNTAASISVSSGGTLVVDGSAFSGATVANGQTVAVTVTASASFSTKTTATVTIGGVSADFAVTTAADQMPTFGQQTIPDQTWTQHQAITAFTLPTATGGDGARTYGLAPALPAGVTRNTTTHQVTGTPSGHQAATTYTWTATDSDNDRTELTFTIAVDGVPTAEAGDNQTVDEGDTVTLSGSGTDPEEQALSYSWRQTSGKTVTLSSTGVAAPTFTAPNLGANEDLVFELTVSDGRLSGTDTVTITIEADNDAPTAAAGDKQTVDEGDAVTLSGSGTDPEGESVTYAWRQTGGSPSVSLTGSTTKTPSFTAPDVAANTTLTFTLTVSDGDLSGTDTVTITIEAADTTPDAFTFTAKTGVAPGTAVTSDAITVSGIEAAASITVSSGGSLMVDGSTFSGATVANGQTVAVTVTASASFSTKTTATVTIGGVSADFAVTTAADQMPTFGQQTIPDQTWTQHQAITAFTLPTATGGDGARTYGLAPALPAGVTRNTTTHQVTGTPSGHQAATTYTWTATDSDNDRTELTFTIAVDGVPTAAAGDKQTVDEGDLVTLSGSGTDPEGESVTYAWRQTSGTTVSLSSTSVVAPTFTAPNLGANEDLAFELTVSDGRLSGTDTVTITIEADNDAPTAAAGDKQTVDEGDLVTLSGSGTDPEGESVTYAWRQTGGSPSVTLTGSTTKTPSFTAPDITANTTLTFTLTVSDGRLSGTDTVTITIEAADTTPDAFAFTAQTEVEPGTAVTSDAITVSGIEAAASISVSSGGSLVVDGSAFTGATITNGKKVAVTVPASTSFNTKTTATVTIGGVSADFSVTTRTADTTPDAFAFTAKTGVEPGTAVTSDAITVSGIEAAASITVSSGGSLVVDGSAFTGATITNGQKVAVTVPASTSFNTKTTATVTIGGVSADFSVTTRTADTTPDAFTFTAQTGVSPGAAVTSDAITVSGIEAAASISVSSGGSLVVDGSAFTGATVANGQKVAVTVPASTSFSTKTTATVTIGGVQGTFSVTTQPADTTPDAFAFTAQTEVEPGTAVTSDAITVSGLNTAASISVSSGGSLVVDGSAFTGATVANGQKVAVTVTASTSFSTKTTATVTIGGVSADFSVTTQAAVIEPPTATATAGWTRIRVDWTPVASVTGYDVQVQGKPFDGGTWPTAWTSVATDIAGRIQGARRRYIHTGLSPDSLYRYQVRSRMDAAMSAWSALVPDAAGIQPGVGTPTGFRAEAGPGAGQVTLRWTGPHHKSITKWRYRDVTALGDETKGGWQDVDVGVSTSGEWFATVKDLTLGQAYRFQVRAVNGAGGGQASAVSDAVVVAAASKPTTTQPPHRLAVQALPNPFNPRTTLRLALPTPETVSLSIYNLSGQRVRVLLNAESLPAGSHTVAWDSRDDHGAPVASGLYLYRLRTPTQVVVGKMALIR